MSTDIRIKEQLPELTRRIVETYQDVPTIHSLGAGVKICIWAMSCTTSAT